MKTWVFPPKTVSKTRKHHFLVLSMRSRAWSRRVPYVVEQGTVRKGARFNSLMMRICLLSNIWRRSKKKKKKRLLSGIILVQWVVFLNEDFFIGLFKELEIRNPKLPSKMLGGIIVWRAVFRFFLRIFFVRATIVRTSLQIIYTELQMSFGGTIYLLLLGNTFLEIVLGF